MSRQTKENKKL